MAKHFVSNKDESVRMFESSLLDSVSRIHWSVPLYIFIPVIIFFLARAIILYELPFLSIAGYFLLGIFIWTFTEYFLHRFIFHFEFSSEWGKRIHFTFHGVHHDYPNDSKRLVMVPSVSIPLASVFYLLFLWIFGGTSVAPLFAGFITGYLTYDMMHYATHHARAKNKLFLKIKQHHMKHHFQQPDLGYGVSQPLWDYVFLTQFPGDRDK